MSHPTAPTSARLDYAGLIASIAAISVAATAFGQSIPLFSILLKSYGASDAVIGLNTGVSAIAAVLGTPFYPRLMTKIGIRTFLLICIAVMVLSYGGVYLVGDKIALWFPLRFSLGLAAAGLFSASETWINTLAPDHLRGRIIGIYGTALASGFAIGPLLVELFGFQGMTPFAVGMAIFASAAVPIAIAKAPPRPEGESASGFFAMLPRAPATFLSAAVFAATESAILIFLPVLTMESGWGPEAGARAVTVYGLGIVALQFVIGNYADRIGAARSLFLCAIASALFAALFIFTTGSLGLLYIVLFVWGGMVAGLYTIGLVIIGGQFSAEDRAAANTGFVFMYGLGSITGPIVAGFVRSTAGPMGLNILLFGTLALYAVYTARRLSAPRP